MLAICVPLFYYSVANERRHARPNRLTFMQRFYTEKNYTTPPKDE